MIIAFIIIVIHYVADFVFQAEEWANNKSTSNQALLNHVATYTTFWVFGSCILFGIHSPGHTVEWYVSHSMIFAAITFVVHFATDYITSRIVKKRFESKYFGSPIPNFGAFSVIGFDQVLHYAQLFLTYYILSK
jgi:hypothetical protein